jgi:hypothetical protein
MNRLLLGIALTVLAPWLVGCQPSPRRLPLRIDIGDIALTLGRPVPNLVPYSTTAPYYHEITESLSGFRRAGFQRDTSGNIYSVGMLLAEGASYDSVLTAYADRFGAPDTSYATMRVRLTRWFDGVTALEVVEQADNLGSDVLIEWRHLSPPYD